jgi:hypothetical protein
VDYRSYVRNDIAEPLGEIPLTTLTSDDIARGVQDIADDGAAGKTIANKHGFLSSALGAAVKAGRIPANPAAGTRLPSTERGEIVFLSRPAVRHAARKRHPVLAAAGGVPGRVRRPFR